MSTLCQLYVNFFLLKYLITNTLYIYLYIYVNFYVKKYIYNI